MKKVLLLFGASGSLARGCINVFSKKDYDKIYLFGKNNTEVDDESIKFIETGDLSNEENVIAAFNNVDFENDARYFLFNTIGGFAGGKAIEEMDYEELQKMLNLNLNISFLLAKHFSKVCLKTKGCAICFTSAMTSLNTAENKAAYGLSKNALNYLVKTLAKEGKKSNLSVNAVAPLVLDTQENREWVQDTSIMVHPEDIGELVYSIFENGRIASGNIIELPGTLA